MKEQVDEQEIFAHSLDQQGIATKAALFISSITNPLLVFLPTTLLIVLHTAPNVESALLWWAVMVIGVSLAPLLFIRQGVRSGRYSDHHISKREQRLIPLLFGLACVLIVFVLLLLLHVSRPLIAVLVALILVVCITIVVTQYWKISLHLVGMAGAVTALGLMVDPLFYWCAPLVLLVGWARWQVHAHSVLQAIAGTILAVSVTLIVCKLFGVY